MTDDQPFEKLAEQAASGLKGDRELYLDVKQELRSHLEETAEKFAHEGHAEDESAELARKSFGSPLDVAADLLDANKRRMKLRALFRLAFGALIVPVAILLALYLGYGRVARVEATLAPMNADLNKYSPFAKPLRTLPFLGVGTARDKRGADILYHLGDAENHPERVRAYWEAHKQEPDSSIYYAYYALYCKTEDERAYVEAMRLGESLEPENALYNVLLAEWYFKRGMNAKGDGPYAYGVPPRDELLDQRLFDLGIAELRRAAGKPYLRTHQREVAGAKLEAMPRPVLTEDYAADISLLSGERTPQYNRYRSLARKIAGSARILILQGKGAEAEAVMDLWRPYSLLLWSDSNGGLMNALLTRSSSAVMAKAAVGVYDKLGAKPKAQTARLILGKLKALDEARKETWQPSREQERQKAQVICEHFLPAPKPYGQHGSYLAQLLTEPLYGLKVSDDELRPGRMHEHVLAEEILLQVILAVLTLLMIASILQGYVSLFRQSRAASVPLLLVLPAADIVRAFLLGILLPMAVYWAYSRLPIIGGRQFGLTSTLWPRFAAEYLILGLSMVLIPFTIVRRRIRRRCDDLDVAVPDYGQETCGYVGAWVSLLIAEVIVIVGAYAKNNGPSYGPTQSSDALPGIFSVLFVGALLAVVYIAGRREKILDWWLRALFLLPAALLIYVAGQLGMWDLLCSPQALGTGILALFALLLAYAAVYGFRWNLTTAAANMASTSP